MLDLVLRAAQTLPARLHILSPANSFQKFIGRQFAVVQALCCVGIMNNENVHSIYKFQKLEFCYRLHQIRYNTSDGCQYTSTRTTHSTVSAVRLSNTTPHTTSVLQPFFRDHLGEPVPEENFWTLWCKGRLTEADTPTIWLGATPSGLTSAHLHHPHIFYGPDALPASCGYQIIINFKKHRVRNFYEFQNRESWISQNVDL